MIYYDWMFVSELKASHIYQFCLTPLSLLRWYHLQSMAGWFNRMKNLLFKENLLSLHLSHGGQPTLTLEPCGLLEIAATLENCNPICKKHSNIADGPFDGCFQPISANYTIRQSPIALPPPKFANSANDRNVKFLYSQFFVALIGILCKILYVFLACLLLQR